MIAICHTPLQMLFKILFQRQKMKDEIQRRQEILRCAGRQRTHRSSFSQENDSIDGQGDAPELV